VVREKDLDLYQQGIMQHHAAVFRDGPILQDGVNKMKEIYKQFKDIKVVDRCVINLHFLWFSLTFRSY